MHAQNALTAWAARGSHIYTTQYKNTLLLHDTLLVQEGNSARALARTSPPPPHTHTRRARAHAHTELDIQKQATGFIQATQTKYRPPKN